MAEHAPTTIPDLLSLFGGPGVNGSFPPVLKRRIGELVMVIQTAIEASQPRSTPQGSAEVEREGAETVTLATVKEVETMSSPMPPSAAKLTDESRLWFLAPSSTSMSTATISVSHSSLFDVGISGEHAQDKEGLALTSSVGGRETYSATRSVLFGSALFKVRFVA